MKAKDVIDIIVPIAALVMGFSLVQKIMGGPTSTLATAQCPKGATYSKGFFGDCDPGYLANENPLSWDSWMSGGTCVCQASTPAGGTSTPAGGTSTTAGGIDVLGPISAGIDSGISGLFSGAISGVMDAISGAISTGTSLTSPDTQNIVSAIPQDPVYALTGFTAQGNNIFGYVDPSQVKYRYVDNLNQTILSTFYFSGATPI